MPPPLVTGISPREGCPGIKITIRGENLGIDEKDFIGLKICGDDCRATATWQSPNKIFAYSGSGQGKGDVIVTTKSGGTGTCSVGFYGRVEQAGNAKRKIFFIDKEGKFHLSFRIGPFQEVAVWVDEDAVTLFSLNTSKAPALLPGGGDVLSGSITDSSYVHRMICVFSENLILDIFCLEVQLQLKNCMKCFRQVNISHLIYSIEQHLCFH